MTFRQKLPYNKDKDMADKGRYVMEIAYCEDDSRDFARAEEMLQEYGRQNPGVNIRIRRFANPQELCRKLESGRQFDIFFLDILMPSMNGIELAKHIRGMNISEPILFLSSTEDFALSSYDVYAYQYLLKPIEKERFFEVMDRLLSGMGEDSPQKVTIKTISGIYTVKLKNICYIEYLNRIMWYHMSDGAVIKSVYIREAFGQSVSEILEDRRFLKIAASFVVNMDYIKKVGKNTFLMEDGTELIISRQYIQESKQKYLDYLLGK